MSNEALAVWRMLFNHANQRHTHSLQGYYSQCRSPGDVDPLLADLLCPLPSTSANYTKSASVEDDGERERDKEGQSSEAEEVENTHTDAKNNLERNR